MNPQLRTKVIDSAGGLRHSGASKEGSVIDLPFMMKHRIQILFAAATAAGLWLSPPATVQAQVSLEVSISGTVFAQGSTNANNTTTTTRAPIKSSLTTATLLRQLAQDEKAAGMWAKSSFPPDARLIYVNGAGFKVVDRHYELLVIATNILSLQTNGQIEITSGSYVDGSAGDAFQSYSQTDVLLATFTYNATAFGRLTTYAVTGVSTSTAKNTPANAEGNSTETDSFRLQYGTGEGTNADGVNIVLAGFTVTGKGKATLNEGQGTSTSLPQNFPPP